MNEVLKCLEERRSCRSYKPDMIPEDVLNQILEAGTYAATGMGKQSPIMIAVTDQKVRDQLSAMNAKIMGVNIDPFYGAPVVIVVLANRAVPTCLYDGSLGKEILKSLDIEGDFEGIGHCILGYPASEAKAPVSRKENYIYRI